MRKLRWRGVAGGAVLAIAGGAALGGSLAAGSAAEAQAPRQASSRLADQTCAGLAGRRFDRAEITSARVQPADEPVEGAFIPNFTGSATGGAPMSGLPEFCRVKGAIRPVPGSEIPFEVWLPTRGWDGRFTGGNNGGLAGYVNYLDLAAAVRAGQAGASTDTGHSNKDSSEVWAKGQPERVRDYGWRSIHLTTVAAKQVIAAYYGRGPDRSYFVGCSNGGRQGLIEAGRFPEDYDGIVVGAPAAVITDSILSMVNAVQAQAPAGAAIRPEQTPFLQGEVLKQCDAVDGKRDGLVDDPRQCRFDYAGLACGSSQSAQCFKPPQIAALKRIHAGAFDRSGRRVVYGYPATGAEVGVPVPFFGWEGTILTGYDVFGQKTLADSILTDLAPTPIATSADLDFTRDPARLKAAVGRDLDAQPDLRRFFARGGKMVMFHGWADPALPAEATIAFYRDVLRVSGPAAMRQLKLFMVPGVQHCAGGPGPDALGQVGAAKPTDTPDRSLAAAVRDWVERGRVPESLIGRTGGVTSAATGSSATAKERLLCAYPAKAVLRPGADPDKAASYACTSAKQG